jgi:hypothetical protein
VLIRERLAARGGGNAEQALHIADERMYVQKNSSRASAGRQSSDVLLRALSERHPSLGEHVRASPNWLSRSGSG